MSLEIVVGKLKITLNEDTELTRFLKSLPETEVTLCGAHYDHSIVKAIVSSLPKDIAPATEAQIATFHKVIDFLGLHKDLEDSNVNSLTRASFSEFYEEYSDASWLADNIIRHMKDKLASPMALYRAVYRGEVATNHLEDKNITEVSNILGKKVSTVEKYIEDFKQFNTTASNEEKSEYNELRSPLSDDRNPWPMLCRIRYYKLSDEEQNRMFEG